MANWQRWNKSVKQEAGLAEVDLLWSGWTIRRNPGEAPYQTMATVLDAGDEGYEGYLLGMRTAQVVFAEVALERMSNLRLLVGEQEEH